MTRLLLSLLPLVFGVALRAAEPLRHAHPSMGTVLEIEITPRREDGSAPLAEALAAMDAVESAVSHWAPDSEISRFNALPAGVPWIPSAHLQHLFAAAGSYRIATGGAFSCHLEPYLSSSGFLPPAPGRPLSGAALAERCATGAVVLSEGRLSKREAGAGLDFDGIAKGYALDLAASHLKPRVRSFALSYGSSGILGGRGAARALALPDPLAPGGEPRYLAAIWLEKGAWSTSSCAENSREGHCHILDPRTLEPVNTALLSATVLAPSAEEADAMSTAVMVLGATEGLRLLRSRGLEGVVVSTDPSPDALASGGLFLRCTPGLLGRVEVRP